MKMTFIRILCIAVITLGAAAAWFILGSALTYRTQNWACQSTTEVFDVWGPAMDQQHPTAFYLAPNRAQGRVDLSPLPGKVQVNLKYEPKKRGLMWHRTYAVTFSAEYLIQNPTPVAQTIYVQFPLPSRQASYSQFAFTLGDEPSRDSTPKDNMVTEAITIPAKQSLPLKVAYASRGMDTWRYLFPNAARVRGFQLEMHTDFQEYNFPAGTASPTARTPEDSPHTFIWQYDDVLTAPAIGMDMPKVLNAGPVATRISFFAPVSLVFFFTVLLLVGIVYNVNLHPVNYFFLAAGCFAFQLLFAYLVDQLPITWSFAIAAVVSLVMVSGYVRAVAGKRLFWVALPAQFCYMVLFSYSFFFDGWTGLTITIGAIITLALLMIFTAKVNWAQKFAKPSHAVTPPALA